MIGVLGPASPSLAADLLPGSSDGHLESGGGQGVMAHPGFWDSMVRDVTGPGMLGGKFQFRLILQPFVVALIIDSILQQMINHHIRPVAALVMGGLLVFVPFVIVREFTNRIWLH